MRRMGRRLTRTTTLQLCYLGSPMSLSSPTRAQPLHCRYTQPLHCPLCGELGVGAPAQGLRSVWLMETAICTSTCWRW